MTTFDLQHVVYEFKVNDAPDISSMRNGLRSRSYIVRPGTVRLTSWDGGKTVRYAYIEGRLVRKTDGQLGDHRGVSVGPRDDPAPDYVNEMLASLGLNWSGGAA